MEGFLFGTGRVLHGDKQSPWRGRREAHRAALGKIPVPAARRPGERQSCRSGMAKRQAGVGVCLNSGEAWLKPAEITETLRRDTFLHEAESKQSGGGI